MLVVCLVIQAVSKTVITEISLAENELSDQGTLLVVRQAGPVDVVLVAICIYIYIIHYYTCLETK